MGHHLVREILEPAMNQLLRSDLQTAARLQTLIGKSVGIWLKEISEPFILGFHVEGVQLYGAAYAEALDAKVELSLFDLPLLTDNASATQAIQQGKLKVTGDPILLQAAANVFKQLVIDWETLLVPYVGDIGAYLLAKPLVRVQASIKDWQPTKHLAPLLSDELGILATQVDKKSLQAQIEHSLAELARIELRIQNNEKEL